MLISKQPTVTGANCVDPSTVSLVNVSSHWLSVTRRWSQSDSNATYCRTDSRLRLGQRTAVAGLSTLRAVLWFVCTRVCHILLAPLNDPGRMFISLLLETHATLRPWIHKVTKSRLLSCASRGTDFSVAATNVCGLRLVGEGTRQS